MPTDSARVERYFQRTATDFDSLYDDCRTWQYRFNRIFRAGLFDRVRLTVAQFQDLNDFDVLDVGCGSGRNSLIFAQSGARRVVGIDFAEQMIALARQAAAAHAAGGTCEFLKGDFLQCDLGRKFDVVVALGVFDYTARPEDLLRRMAQVARKKVIGSFPGVSPLRAPLRKLRYALRNCPVYFYTRRELKQICAKAGITDFEILPCASSGFVLVGRVEEPGSGVQ